MLGKILALACATASLVSAIPVSREFGIMVSLSGHPHNMSVMAVNNGTSNTKVVQLVPLKRPGTPVFFNASQEIDGLTFHALNFVIDVGGQGAYYGLAVPEVGDDYGYAGSVTATLNEQQIQWRGGPNGGIYHAPQAALDEFFVCDDHADNGPGKFLKWGIPYSNFTNPVGCESGVGIYKK